MPLDTRPARAKGPPHTTALPAWRSFSHISSHNVLAKRSWLLPTLRAWGEGEARSKGGPLLKPLLAPTFPSAFLEVQAPSPCLFPATEGPEAASPPHRDPVPSLSLKTVSRARCHLLLPLPLLTWNTHSAPKTPVFLAWVCVFV